MPGNALYNDPVFNNIEYSQASKPRPLPVQCNAVQQDEVNSRALEPQVSHEDRALRGFCTMKELGGLLELVFLNFYEHLFTRDKSDTQLTRASQLFYH